MIKPWHIVVFAVAVLAALGLTIALTHPAGEPQPSEPSSTTTQPTLTRPTPPDDSPTQLRLYQCDPELAQVWQEIAAVYTARTGVVVTVITPESGADCRETLTGLLAGDEAPTIFCLHGSSAGDLAESCLDLTGSAVAGELIQDMFALKDGDATLGVAGSVESYGIIYNSRLLARAGFTATDIFSFESLRDVVENITANSKALGFSAFATPDLTSTERGSQLYLLSGLAQQENALLRALWELYCANCATSAANIGKASAETGVQDFQDGRAVFYLGGTWDYVNLNQIEDYNLGFLPIFSRDEENTGLRHTSVSYWCINVRAEAEQTAAALDFLHWLVTAQEDDPAPADALQLLLPYRQTSYAGNPLQQQVLASIMEQLQAVHWTQVEDVPEATMLELGAALGVYAAAPTDENWAAVTAAIARQLRTQQ